MGNVDPELPVATGRESKLVGVFRPCAVETAVHGKRDF
jgi:hypothetical protein